MEHLYIVTYDISSPRRWRRVFRIMEGYGDWLQLSVFQCRLAKARLIQLEAELGEAMHQIEDHVLILDLGPMEGVTPKVKSLGKAFRPVLRQAVIV
jgi:CRISPR-associated protein Cas2